MTTADTTLSRIRRTHWTAQLRFLGAILGPLLCVASCGDAEEPSASSPGQSADAGGAQSTGSTDHGDAATGADSAQPQQQAGDSGTTVDSGHADSSPVDSGHVDSGKPAAGGSDAGGKPDASSVGVADSGTGAVDSGSGSGVASSVFSQCRFHFGTIDSIAKNTPSMIQELDLFTPGWMGQSDTFDMQYVCDYTKSGGTFANQVPAIVAYVAAFYAKRHDNLKDCNAPGAQQDLCVVGAGFIQQNLTQIIAVYESYAAGFAACYGTTRPIIFEMEPDFYQYTISGQNSPWTGAYAGQTMSQFVDAIKKHLPNAVFSMDISPWVGPSNGGDNGRSWYGNFDMSLFTFINTSGGGTDATSTKIRSSNAMTWAGVHQVTGKPILADTGYGVNGGSAGPDPNWDNPVNINARMQDGVVAVTQYNPASSWGSTLAAARPSLGKPSTCP